MNIDRAIISGNLFQSQMVRGKKECLICISLYWKKFA